ncbi:ATP-binding protein [Pectinatus frisingensis]|jgi:predicted AAA+ superfamily ATPase|uniref:ATP-binding protein n=2 Tax=Pectinatus frisingensis TaxID=865 RepID=UPI001E34370E|nr:ATP-binding protein [Pectinatus frisingensis]
MIRIGDTMDVNLTQLITFPSFRKNKIIRLYSNAVSDPYNITLQHSFLSALVQQSEQLGLSGQLFSAYIIYLLSEGNNLAAASIRQGKFPDKSLQKLLKIDMEVIYPYLKIDLLGDNKIIDIVNAYSPVKTCSNELYALLSQALSQTQSAEEATLCLLDHYKKFGSGKMAHYRAFYWNNNSGLNGIKYFESIKMSDLIGYDRQKQTLIDNTIAFIKNKPANNVLLVGARGTGKSSGVKALINEYYEKGLRLLQITRDQIKLLPDIMEHLRQLAGYKFIVFLDDLSFNETETEYKYLKSVIEGGISSIPSNVVLYATSNRRHLIKETWNDREDTQDELYRNDSVNESISLSDRFGIIIVYDAPNQDEYLQIIDSYLQKTGIKLDNKQLRIEGLRWELTHSGRSGRVARQFVNWYLGQYK